jgi:hypothetical protein
MFGLCLRLWLSRAESVGLNDWLDRNTPRRILAVVAGPEKADYIAGWVRKAGFPPKPMLVGGKLCELIPSGTKTIDLIVQVLALEVDDYAGVASWVVDRME